MDFTGFQGFAFDLILCLLRVTPWLMDFIV